MASQRILLLLVNYFNETEICSFVLEQIQSQTWKQLEVVITDNGSHDHNKLLRLSTDISWVHIFQAVGNIGYLPGAAYGLSKYLDMGFDFPQFVILANSDIEFENDMFLETLAMGKERSEYDIIGPDIFSDLLHHHQNPLMTRRISILKLRALAFFSSNALLHYLFLTFYYGKSLLKLIFHKEGKEDHGIIPVYGVHGSFMIFNKSFFNKGGTLDYPFHLFGEEIYLAEFALENRMLVGYDPGLKIIHHEHQTTGIYESRKSVRQMNRSYNQLLDLRKRGTNMI